MKIIFVDNEQSSHINFTYEMRQRENVASLDCFFTAEEALAHAKDHQVDCAFLDIDLGEKSSGLDLARELKALQPCIEVAFLTAYNEHARVSYQLGGRAYITKPYSAKEIDEALNVMERLRTSSKKDVVDRDKPTAPIQIRTFGNFDLILDGCAVPFKTAKAKEALAFLVHQKGGSVSGAQLFFTLWEAQEYTATTAIYVRRTISALQSELDAMGIGDLLIRSRNCYSVDTSRFSCDCYALMDGSPKAAAHFDGVYMGQYSWGESTIPLLDRAVQNVQGEILSPANAV